MRSKVQGETKLTVSAGIAPTKVGTHFVRPVIDELRSAPTLDACKGDLFYIDHIVTRLIPI
jgi:hypothetical protein